MEIGDFYEGVRVRRAVPFETKIKLFVQTSHRHEFSQKSWSETCNLA